MKRLLTRHCYECEHAKWTGEILLDLAHNCLKGHKPRYYMPKGPMDETAGFKRKCEDYKEKKVGA